LTVFEEKITRKRASETLNRRLFYPHPSTYLYHPQYHPFLKVILFFTVFLRDPGCYDPPGSRDLQKRPELERKHLLRKIFKLYRKREKNISSITPLLTPFLFK